MEIGIVSQNKLIAIKEIMKFDINFIKSVLGFYESRLGGIPRDNVSYLGPIQ